MRVLLLLSMEWKGRKGERREKKERAWEVVASEASLADWLAGQCGVVDFESRISEARTTLAFRHRREKRQRRQK